MAGKGYRIDVTQTYVVNTDFLAQARKVEESGHKMLVQRPTGHDSARARLRRLQHSTAHEMSSYAGVFALHWVLCIIFLTRMCVL